MFQLRNDCDAHNDVIVRLVWPSCYYPATASVQHPIASPVTARVIAFVAELHFYVLWALWCSVEFWGTYLWIIVLFGEVVSTTGVLL